MNTVELSAQQGFKNLVKVTKEEQVTQNNNAHLPEIYKSCPISMLTKYLQTLKEEFYDVDMITNLLDDIRYYEITNPVVERLHMNLETSMHNKALHGIQDKSNIFKNMMKDYYIIHDIECDLINTFLSLIQKHIDASKHNAPISYLATLGIIRDNVDFKYSSNIETYTISTPISDEELYTKKSEYLENMIIRCMWEIAKFSNDDLTNENIYAKANALAIYLKSALSLVENKRYVDEYKQISNLTPMSTTAKGIVNTAFIQEKAITKQLVKDDENGK